jgi:hypothetical protein
MVIIVERRGREDGVDGVIREMKEPFRQSPEKWKNNKSKLPQGYAKRPKTMPFPCFAASVPLAMTTWPHDASPSEACTANVAEPKFNNLLTALTFFVIIC